MFTDAPRIKFLPVDKNASAMLAFPAERVRKWGEPYDIRISLGKRLGC